MTPKVSSPVKTVRRVTRILGVDPGSLVTGFGVVDKHGSDLVLVEQGSIRLPRGAELPTRLEKIFNGLCEVIDRTRPGVVAVEAPFAGRNAKSLIQLAHARGVVLLAARTRGLEIVEYSPRTVKSAVVGFGGAEKAQVAHMVRLLVKGIGQARMGPDAADALAVAICHAHTSGISSRARNG